MDPIKTKDTRQACARCRTQKRKCDKALPECGLCTRLKRTCIYDTAIPDASGSSTTPSEPEGEPVSAASSLSSSSETEIRAAILEKLPKIAPEEVATSYFHSIQTWFPIISFTELCARLPRTWDQASTDLCLLFISMSLLTQVPTLHMSRQAGLPQEIESSYLSLKSWIAVLEGRGMNSLDSVNSRTLLVLFEVVHGNFPAAYISIGSLFRAADALHIYCKDQKNNCSETWRGILILDRCISLEQKHWPSVSRYRSFNYLKSHPSPTESPTPTPFAFARLFEASDILSAVQKAVHERKPDGPFNFGEIPHPATLEAFRNTLAEEVPQALKVYSSSWAIFNTALLLLHEQDKEGVVRDSDVLIPPILSRAYKEELLLDICEVVRPFVEEDTVLNFQLLLPPFITYLVYKGAIILTRRLQMGDVALSSMKMLKAMRIFLKLVSARWLIAAYFSALLDEDTTPRMAKALEETTLKN